MSTAPSLPAVRAMTPRDIPAAGAVLHAAFSAVYDEHGFRSPFPSAEAGAWLAQSYLDLDPEGALVCVFSGEVVGVGFLHLRGAVGSIGPVAARPGAPRGIGRSIMEGLLKAADAARLTSVRLFQDAFNPRSFALYSKLGFTVRDAVAYAIADPLESPRDLSVAPITRGGMIRAVIDREIPLLLALDRELGAADRTLDFDVILRGGGGMAYALWRGSTPQAFLLVREGASRLAIAPAVARDEGDLLALLAHTCAEFEGRAASVRVPTSRGIVMQTLLRWGFRVDHLGNLMVRGEDHVSGAHLLAMFPESL